MYAGNLRLKLRPLRLAFIVDPTNAAAIREAFQICSFLWGGSFNPIIPAFRRFSKRERFVYQNAKRQNVVTGYIDAFDPDFVVLTGGVDIASLDIGSRKVIKSGDVLNGVKEDGTPTYGIGLFEILQQIVAAEFKFVRQTPLRIHIPKIEAGADSLFLASVFGLLPEDFESELIEQLKDLPGFVHKLVSLNSYADLLGSPALFPRRVSMHKIKPLRHWHRRGDCVFFLDPNSSADVLDYWNLRALGWNVVPVCRSVSSEANVRALVETFVNENAFPLKGNPDIYNDTTFIPSGSTSMDDVKEFGKALKLNPRKHRHDLKISYQWWFPRIWDEWAREKDAATPCDFDIREDEHQISGTDDSISFKGLMPNFAYRFGGHGKPRCANDIRLRLWSPRQVFAEVIPEGDQHIASAAGAMGWEEWRCSRTGLVHLPIHKDWREHLGFPIAERVFKAWLQQKGWNAEISDKGHIAERILKQLGGVLTLNILSLPSMIELLDRATRDGILRAGAMRTELVHIAKTDKYRFLDANRLLDRLIEHQIIQLGLFLQCPTCRQRSWHSVTAADYEMICPKCLQSFSLPLPGRLRWAYRTIGPFSLPRYAYGAYAVLLTHRFFARLLDCATTPMFSFIAKKHDKQIEVDLGLFCHLMRYGNLETDLVFAECKTFSEFARTDVERIGRLSTVFPGAVMVFATLRKSLKPKEQRLLRPLVNRGRKYWKTGRPYNPVLILTGNELLADKGPRHQWEELGGEFKRHSRTWGDERELVSLADATQQIYLGMQPWHTWLEQRYKRRSRAKIVAQPSGEQSRP
jgi:hypothetical protein